MSLYVSVKDACDLTSLSRATLYRVIAEGGIKTAKVRRRRLVLRESLTDWIPKTEPSPASEAAASPEHRPAYKPVPRYRR